MSSAIRNFVVMFFLFLIIFGICGHFIATNLVPDLIASEDDENNSNVVNGDVSSELSVEHEHGNDNESEPDDSQYETYTVAFFCLGLEDELVEIYMVHINDGYKTCVSASIPAVSTAEVGGFTFEQIYRKNGIEHLVNKLKYLTGYTIDDHACLKAVDRNGRGHSITDLSKRFGYNYRINEAFEYPDPLYEIYQDKLENDRFNENEESSEAVSEESVEDKTPDEFFTVQPDNYSLHGITNGLNNYTILLDSEYNPNAHAIYGDFFKRLLNNKDIVNSVDEQKTVLKCFENKTFSIDNYESTEAAKYLFKYENQHIDCPCEKISDWDNVKNTLKAKEQGKID